RHRTHIPPPPPAHPALPLFPRLPRTARQRLRRGERSVAGPLDSLSIGVCIVVVTRGALRVDLPLPRPSLDVRARQRGLAPLAQSNVASSHRIGRPEAVSVHPRA